MPTTDNYGCDDCGVSDVRNCTCDHVCTDCTLDGCDGTGDECPCNYECHGGPIESATDDKGE